MNICRFACRSALISTLLIFSCVSFVSAAPEPSKTKAKTIKDVKVAAKPKGKSKVTAEKFPAPKGKSPVALALAQPETKSIDSKFLAAREAFRQGDRSTLTRLESELSDHELAIYLAYWRLSQSVADINGDVAATQSFLNRYEGEYPAERLRISLIKELAKRGQWEEVSREYARLIAPEQDVLCLNLQARLQRGDETAFAAIRKLWNEPTENGDSCQPLLDRFANNGNLSNDEIWNRAHRLVEVNRLGNLRHTLDFLPNDIQPDNRHLDQATDRAPLWLGQLHNNNLNIAANRQLFAMALQRVARNDPSQAASQLRIYENSLNRDERARAWSHIALQGAKRLMPEARDWYKLTTPAVLSDENAQWKVRTALRAQDWGMVRDTIEGMPTDLAKRPEWVYWLGRAYKAGGRLQDADTLFNRIANQPHFYGNLADEELGRRITVPPAGKPASRAELSAISERPGIKRALAWFRLDQRTEGVKEWNWALKGMTDRDLLAAADMANKLGIFDRAISAADRTRTEHDYSLRYLTPYSDEIRTASRNQSVDDAWVYGLMRQESRFITGARSNVGAAGLMQLMPATAKWVANKIGLKNYSHSQVHDTTTNVLLGTTYMRLVLENLDNHPVLASAAYNAGPGRARKWRADTPLEGAIYAESIPFAETRDYVKKVMSNAVYYSVLFNGKPESLRDRLGVIPANGSAINGNANTLKNPDLP